MKKFLCVLLCGCMAGCSKAQPDSIKLLFIYGSRPAKGFENIEPRWFGGVRGGHVAIQIASDSVLSFRSTQYPCHIFSKHKKQHLASVWEFKTVTQAWQTFPPHHYIIDSLQRAVVTIPINSSQRKILDSLAVAYTQHVPYDYAVFGTRCASATYDVLQQTGIVPYHRHGNWLRIFTVRALRKRLFRKVKQPGARGWTMQMYNGGKSRRWEHDVR